MNDRYWNKLKCEECCFTCKNNRNNLKRDCPCDCEFENRKYNTSQDIWCRDYEITELLEVNKNE